MTPLSGWLDGTRRTLRDVASDRRMALMLVLGFGAGLPILLVFATLSAWLRSVGIARPRSACSATSRSPIR